MIAIILLVAASGADSLFSQWFPQPAGESAFEDYTRAADTVATREFGILSNWRAENGKVPDFPTAHLSGKLDIFKPLTDDEASSLQSQLKPNDFETLCRLEEARYGMALDLIRSGNRKAALLSQPAYQQQDYFAAMMPYFGALANLALRSAYAKFAEGKTPLGVQILIDQLNFTDNLTRFGPTGPIIASDIEPRVFAFFKTHLGNLSQEDCTELRKGVSNLLAKPAPQEDEFRSIEKFWESRIAHFIHDELPKLENLQEENPGDLHGELDVVHLAKEIQKLSVPEQQDLIARADRMSNDAMSSFESRFSEAERNWLTPLPANQLFKSGGVTAADDLAAQVAYHVRAKLLTLYSLRGAVSRVRLRLLGLHARILEFKWRNARLPQSLDELGPGVSPDPMTGKPFQYVINRDGSYDLASLGTSETGLIQLDGTVASLSNQAVAKP